MALLTKTAILTKAAIKERERIVDALVQCGWERALAAETVEILGESAVYVDRTLTVPMSAAFRPTFRLFNETRAEWNKRTMAEFLSYRNKLGRDWSPVFQGGPRRGPGKKGRNTPLNRRYEWAAMRVDGWSWKRIAKAHNPAATGKALTSLIDTVRRAVASIFQTAEIEDPYKPNRR